MRVSRLRFAVYLVLCCGVFAPAIAWQTEPAHPVRRIYVEPFTTRQGSEKFREEVVAELRKMKSVSDRKSVV